jgi:hypothetical protein
VSEWEVVACLLVLRTEFNTVSPKRDKGADGTIGDAAHNPDSDHTPDEDSPSLRGKDADRVNEVHALDVDSTGPWPDGKRGDIAGSWFDKTIHRIIAVQKARWNDPDDMCQLNYIIWRGVIYDKDNNWVGVPYHGEDPHTNHAHFSARYETRAEKDKRPWGVSGGIMATLDDADIKAIAKATAEEVWKIQKDRVEPLPGQTATASAGGVLWALDGNIRRSTAAMLAAIKAIEPSLDVDEGALARELLAALPADLARQVVDEFLALPPRPQAG